MAGERESKVVPPAERALELAENTVYILVALFLVVGAVTALGAAGYTFVDDLAGGQGTRTAITDALDGLLLVFILLELLAAVRATMRERQLVAEPFLMVGIIVAIKEIVVAALEAKDSLGQPGKTFDDAMTQIGLLGGLVLVLAVASFLVRRKEREPDEG